MAKTAIRRNELDLHDGSLWLIQGEAGRSVIPDLELESELSEVKEIEHGDL